MGTMVRRRPDLLRRETLSLSRPYFGDVNADACDVSFKFGLDGKPAYIQGP
jgi:hypothetical protein